MLRILLFSIFSFFCTFNALAGDDFGVEKYPEVRQYLKSSFNKLEDATSVDNKKILVSILEKNLDFEGIVKAVLGRPGMYLGEEKLHKFHSAYKEYLIKVYIEKLQLINLDEGRLEIDKVAQDTKNENIFAVTARFIDKDSNEISMNALITKQTENFMIFDIAVENIGIIASHRDAFMDRVTPEKIDSLIELIEKKNQE